LHLEIVWGVSRQSRAGASGLDARDRLWLATDLGGLGALVEDLSTDGASMPEQHRVFLKSARFAAGCNSGVGEDLGASDDGSSGRSPCKNMQLKALFT
jgi:hypothetical protein